MEEVLISNEEEFEKKVAMLKKLGSKNIHVISDFDRTLTRAFVDGCEKVNTVFHKISLSGYLPDEYKRKSMELNDKYYPVELDINVPIEEKQRVMTEWSSTNMNLMIKYGLSLAMLKDIAELNAPLVRDGFERFMHLLDANSIPFLIFSAGIGNVIDMYLDHNGLNSSNVHIVSNFFHFDDDCRVAGYNMPIITSYNKNESSMSDEYFSGEVCSRPGVILLGDSLGDLTMADGVEHDCILKIGFFNTGDDELLHKYRRSFDVVILNDGPLDYVNGLLEGILS